MSKKIDTFEKIDTSELIDKIEGLHRVHDCADRDNAILDEIIREVKKLEIAYTQLWKNVHWAGSLDDFPPYTQVPR